MPERSEKTQLVRNAVGSYGSRALLALSALLVTPYLYRKLGAAGFGTWSVIFTLGTVFSLLQIGFSAGPVKYVAEFRAQGKRRELEETLGAAVALMSVLGVVALGLSACAAFLLDGLAAGAEREDFRLGMLAVGAAMLVRFPCAGYMAVLNGYQRFDLTNASFGFSVVVFSLGAFVAVEAGKGVLGVAIAQAVALTASGLLFIVMLARVDPALSPRPRLAERETRRRLFRFSSFALLADSMAFAGQRMDVVLIAAIRNATQAAPYAAAVKLQSGLQSFVLPFVELMMPMVSELWAQGRREEVARRFELAVRVALQFTLPAAFGVALLATDIVDVWLGPGAPDVTASIIVALMAVQVAVLSSAPAEKVLVGIGRVRLVGAIALLEGVANVALTVFLVWRFGAIGAALGTLITAGILAPVKLPLACRAAGCPVGRTIGAAVGKAGASSLPAMVAMAVLWAVLPEGAVRLFAALGAGAAAWTLVGVAQVGPTRIGLGGFFVRKTESGLVGQRFGETTS
jgi:O-antigen/teichoic acid export membrane protein